VISVFLTVVPLLPIASFGQTARRFPSTKSELISPDGRWALQNVDQEMHPAAETRWRLLPDIDAVIAFYNDQLTH
jgi:hypothetical protein